MCSSRGLHQSTWNLFLKEKYICSISWISVLFRLLLVTHDDLHEKKTQRIKKWWGWEKLVTPFQQLTTPQSPRTSVPMSGSVWLVGCFSFRLNVFCSHNPQKTHNFGFLSYDRWICSCNMSVVLNRTVRLLVGAGSAKPVSADTIFYIMMCN